MEQDDARLITTLRAILEIESGDAEGLPGRIAQMVADALGADKVDLFLHDPADDTLAALDVSATSMARREHDLGLDRLPLAHAGPLADVLRSGVPFQSSAATRDLGAAAVQLGIQSSLAVPLAIAGERRGVLMAVSARPDAFDAGSLRALDLLSRLTTLLIDRAHTAQTRAEAARLAEVDRLRREFIATTSHALQTMLTSIHAGVALLAASAHERLTPEERRLQETVRDNVERLRRYILDLLTAGQIEAGTLQLASEPLDLRDPVREAVATIGPDLETVGLVRRLLLDAASGAWIGITHEVRALPASGRCRAQPWPTSAAAPSISRSARKKCCTHAEARARQEGCIHGDEQQQACGAARRGRLPGRR